VLLYGAFNTSRWLYGEHRAGLLWWDRVQGRNHRSDSPTNRNLNSAVTTFSNRVTPPRKKSVFFILPLSFVGGLWKRMAPLSQGHHKARKGHRNVPCKVVRRRLPCIPGTVTRREAFDVDDDVVRKLGAPRDSHSLNGPSIIHQ
jgi:hypothetical protein